MDASFGHFVSKVEPARPVDDCRHQSGFSFWLDSQNQTLFSQQQKKLTTLTKIIPGKVSSSIYTIVDIFSIKVSQVRNVSQLFY
jgi:hypothetical protein